MKSIPLIYVEAEEKKEKPGDDKKAKEGIKALIDTKWSETDETQGKAVAILKGLSFSQSDIANKFMAKLDKYTDSLEKEFLG